MQPELIAELLLQGVLMHKATPTFFRLLNSLPQDIQAIAKKQFDLLKRDPTYPSLHFKFMREKGVWEAYVTNRGVAYRALARQSAPGVYEWFFIGTHKETERVLKNM